MRIFRETTYFGLLASRLSCHLLSQSFQLTLLHSCVATNVSAPDYGIIGAQKGGTTALAGLMRNHPELCLSKNEIHVFSHARSTDEVTVRWPAIVPRARLACEKMVGALVGFDDPAFSYYAVGDPEHYVSFASFAPRMKLIMLLREPIERARSQHGMMVAGTKSSKFLKKRSLEEVVREEVVSNGTRRDPYDIFRRGLYHEQVGLVLERYHRSQLLVVVSERAFASTAAYDDIFQFLGVQPLESSPQVYRRPTKRKSHLSRATLELLAHEYRDPTDKLFVLLGGPIPEWERWYAAAGLPLTSVGTGT